jgi:malonyl-CoA O-methyltransferase
MSRLRAIGRNFGAAAERYEGAAVLQRLVAHRLAARIAGAIPDPDRAALRILEIGCGTGLLTRALRLRLPQARILATDLAPGMLAACRSSLPDDDRLQLLAMDGAAPAVAGGFDLICSSLALQWFADPGVALAGLMRLLAPGGRLELATLVSGSLPEWQAAHRAEGLADGGLVHPELATLQAACGGGWEVETVLVPHADGRAFLRALRDIGAQRPRDGHRALDAGRMRRVLRRFEDEHGAAVSYRVAYGSVRRPTRRGVFVTGTDTGIGKTVVSACLVRAWGAEYWKPFQTGLEIDAGDSDTVRALSGCGTDRIHPPALELPAALSPEDAAREAGIVFDSRGLTLPGARVPGDPPLVVEGAGGVLVPLDPHELTVALIGRLGLPVVLVARSTLGTINHTLLSLAALRARGIPVAGVVLNGPPSAGNRAAIERHGQARVLAELPVLDRLDAAAVAGLDSLWGAAPGTDAG